VHRETDPAVKSIRWFSRTKCALAAAVAVAAGALLPAACADSKGRVEAFRTGRATTKATGDLRRGINFGDAMDAPNEGDWGPVLSASDFKVVRDAGFDHVRVPMRFSAHVDTRPPYRVQSRFFARVDWVIDQALSNDLSVIIDLHHFVELMKAPHAYAERLVSIWKQIATRYRGLPPAVVFEILNEPTDNMTAEIWNPILARVIAEIRAIDPTRTLIVEGVHWASAKDLRDTLRVPENDGHLIASFHMYAPMYFTHQGFSWMPPQYATRGVVFPGPPPRPVQPAASADAFPESHDFFARYNSEPAETNPGGPAAIIEQMEMGQAFADRTKIPIYLGEFGAGINADITSRANWARVARTECEKRGFGWGYWDFSRNFAAYSSMGFTGSWIPEMKAALLQ
jgi:endoglucanase